MVFVKNDGIRGTLRGAFLMQKISVQRAQLQRIYISSLLLSGRNRRSFMELAGLYFFLIINWN